MEEEKRRKKKRIEERKKKKISMEKEGVPRAGPTLLTVQRVTAVRCN
jgi:hypothetical protein